MLDKDFQDKILFEFNKLIAYLNKNSGAIGVIIAILIPIFSVVGKTLHYSYLYGYGQYFNISIHNVEISENFFYSIFVYSILIFIFFGISMIPYFIYKSDIKSIGKIVWIFILFIFTFIFFIIYYCIFENLDIKELYKIQYFKFKDICIIIVVLIVLVNMGMYILGIIFIIIDFIKKSNINKVICILFLFMFIVIGRWIEEILKGILFYVILYTIVYIIIIIMLIIMGNISKSKFKSLEEIISFLIFIVVLHCFIFFFLGKRDALEKRDFKIIEKDKIKYAIIYEDYQKYIITECEIKTNNQNVELVLKDINEKQNIDKNGIKYKQLSFNKVIKK